MEWTDFCMVVQIQESEKIFQWLLGGPGHLVYDALKSAE